MTEDSAKKKLWWVSEDGGQPEGPMTWESICDQVRKGCHTRSLLLRSEDMADWLPASAFTVLDRGARDENHGNDGSESMLTSKSIPREGSPLASRRCRYWIGILSVAACIMLGAAFFTPRNTLSNLVKRTIDFRSSDPFELGLIEIPWDTRVMLIDASVPTCSCDDPETYEIKIRLLKMPARDPLSGEVVQFRVAEGNGALDALSASTDAEGFASVRFKPTSGGYLPIGNQIIATQQRDPNVTGSVYVFKRDLSAQPASYTSSVDACLEEAENLESQYEWLAAERRYLVLLERENLPPSIRLLVQVQLARHYMLRGDISLAEQTIGEAMEVWIELASEVPNTDRAIRHAFQDLSMYYPMILVRAGKYIEARETLKKLINRGGITGAIASSMMNTLDRTITAATVDSAVDAAVSRHVDRFVSALDRRDVDEAASLFNSATAAGWRASLSEWAGKAPPDLRLKLRGWTYENSRSGIWIAMDSIRTDGRFPIFWQLFVHRMDSGAVSFGEPVW